MTTERIDVLAVMDGFANRASYDFPALTVAELREARAAVAELIEADREYDLAAAALRACTNKPAHAFVALLDYADAARNRFEAAKARRAAAIARVGGA